MKKFVFQIILIFLTNFSCAFAEDYSLIKAVKKNDIFRVKFYLRSVNINQVDKKGNTALTYAIENENYDIVKLLLENGAQAKLIDGSNYYTYCSAKTSRHFGIRVLFEDYDINKCFKQVTKNGEIKYSADKKNSGGFFTWKGAGITTAVVGGAVVLAAGLGGGGGGGGGSGDNSGDDDSSSEYDSVGQVNDTTLQKILNGTNTTDSQYYSGYTYSTTFSNGKTYSNFDDYNKIRLAYAWARGFAGKVSSSSYLSSSSGTPSYLSSASGTSSYSIGDSIKVAVVDQGVFSGNNYISGNLTSATGSIDSNQLYQYYLNNCVSSSCSVYASYGSSSYTTKYLKCTSGGSGLSCNVYNDSSATDVISGSSFTLTSNDTTPATDDSTHGTAVSNIIAANPVSGSGISGVAPEATVIPYTIAMEYDYSVGATDYSIQSFADYSYIGDAFESAGANGAVAINNSWGSSYSSSITNESSLTSYFGSDFLNSIKTTVSTYDSIFVWAAGNSGTSQPSSENLIPLYLTDGSGNLLFYDSSTGYYKNFITVVAYDTANDTIASWSDKCGLAKNYCLTAPGTNIVTSSDGSSTIVAASGTSFAAPIVTGAIAVLKSAFPYLTGADITRLLFVTARDLGATGVDSTYGWGMLDLERATRPYGATLVPINSTISASSISLTSSSLELSSSIANSIQKANLSFVILDDFNRTFTLNLNDYLVAGKNRLNTIDVLNNFSSNNAKMINLNKNKSFNFYASNSVIDNHNYQEFEFSSGIENITDNNYGFNFYFGNNPYNAFISDKVDFYNDYSLAKSYNYNVLNPYFTSNSDYNFGVNNIIKLNDNFSANFGVIYQNYEMNFQEKYYDETEDDDLGSSFSVLSGMTYNLNKHISTKLEFSILNEYETLLGSQMEGAFGIGENNLTYIASLQNDVKLSDKFSIFGKVNFGLTKANTNSELLIKDISTLYSNSYAFGMDYSLNKNKDKSENISLLLFQPVQIKSGNMQINLPVARDTEGNIYYQNNKVNLKDEKEIDLQLAYNKVLNKDSSFNFGLIYRDYIDNEAILLFKYKRLFNF